MDRQAQSRNEAGVLKAPVLKAPTPSRRTEILDEELAGLVRRAVTLHDRLESIADTQFGPRPKAVTAGKTESQHAAVLDRLDNHTGDLASLFTAMEVQVERFESL